MARSELGICNQAVSWLGGDRITVLGEDSVESDLCVDNYEGARDVTLEARDWTFAKSRKKLLPSSTPPDFGWTAQFQLPPDCIRVIKACRDTSLKIPIAWEREGQVILANEGVIYMTYISRVEDPKLFSPGFIQACTSRLAADIALTLTSSEKMETKMEKKYETWVESAGAMDGIQGRSQVLQSSTLIGSR